MPIHSVTQSRIAAGYNRLCKRWVSPSAAGGATAERDARMAGAFLGMPLMLAVALTTSHSIAGELDAMLSLVAGVLALPMIFCGALSVSKNSASVGMSALMAYSLSVTAISVTAPSTNLLLWIMAAAIPLETWFIGRNEKSIRLPVGIAAAMLATLLRRCDAGRRKRDIVALGAACFVRLSGDTHCQNS